MTKCGLPVETSTPATCRPSASVTVCSAKVGTPIPAVTSTVYSAPFLSALTRQTRRPASVSICSSSPGEAAFQRHPRRHAACAVAADLGDRAVGVVQANAARLGAGPGEVLDAVGADAGIARAKLPRYFGQSGPRTASSVTIRKSLPQAWALVKESNFLRNTQAKSCRNSQHLVDGERLRELCREKTHWFTLTDAITAQLGLFRTGLLPREVVPRMGAPPSRRFCFCR